VTVPVPAISPPSAPEAARTDGSEPGLEAAVDRLVDECRSQCLWYVRPDYYPSTDGERLEILEAIQERSTLADFQRAGALKAWLSRRSSDESASS
jgi:hypothetical protein